MRKAVGVWVVVAEVLSLAPTARAVAQGRGPQPVSPSKVVSIGPANATIDEEFARLISVRELSNGRVILADDKEKRLVAVDFVAKTARTLGRAGEGPQEYREVGRLWDVGGDSTFMSVPYARRWLLLHRDSIVSTFTGQLPVILKVGSTIIRGADAHGNVLGLAPLVRVPDQPFVMPDSFTFVRTNRTSLKVDTVFRTINSDKNIVVRNAAARGTAAPPPEQRRYSISLKARDQAAMFPDGAIAVLRGMPFRVDWCLVAGRPCSQGAPLERGARALSDADKLAYLKAMNALGAWPPTENVDQTLGWPEKMPSFATPGGADEANFWAAPSGNVVVERLPNARTPLFTYDVVNRGGLLVARVSVPPGHRVLGFGARSVYIIRVDDDDIQHLQRHAWSY